MVLTNLFALYISSLTALTGSFTVTRGNYSSIGTSTTIVDYGYTINDFVDSRNNSVGDGDIYYVAPTDYQPEYLNTSLHYVESTSLPLTTSNPRLTVGGVKYNINYANQIVPYLDLQNWGSWDRDTRLFECSIGKRSTSDAINLNFQVFQAPYVNLVVGVDVSILFEYGDDAPVLRTCSFTFPLFTYASGTSYSTYNYQDFYYFSEYSDGATAITLFTDISWRVAYLTEVANNIEEDLQDTYEEYYNNGYSTGYSNGYGDGYNYGWSLGESSRNSFRNLFGTLIDTPIIYLRKMFDYELFGISVFKALATVISLIVALSVFRLVRGIF